MNLYVVEDCRWETVCDLHVKITHFEIGSETIHHSYGENGITLFGSGHNMKVTFTKEI